MINVLVFNIFYFQMRYRDLGEHVPVDELERRFKKFDRDNNGTIDFEEFAKGTYELIRDSKEIYNKASLKKRESLSNLKVDEKDGEDEEEEEQVPDDLADLSPSEQQTRIKIRSAYMMGLGTFLVLLFSDPMVDVLNEIGVRLVRNRSTRIYLFSSNYNLKTCI